MRFLLLFHSYLLYRYLAGKKWNLLAKVKLFCAVVQPHRSRNTMVEEIYLLLGRGQMFMHSSLDLPLKKYLFSESRRYYEPLHWKPVQTRDGTNGTIDRIGPNNSVWSRQWYSEWSEAKAQWTPTWRISQTWYEKFLLLYLFPEPPHFLIHADLESIMSDFFLNPEFVIF